MSIDQLTEAVITLSGIVERSRAQLEDARKAHVVAAERENAAQRHLDAAIRALNEAIRAKAAADLERTHGAGSADAFRLRFPEKSELVEAQVRDLARRSYAAGQAAAVAKFTGGSFNTSTSLRPTNGAFAGRQGSDVPLMLEGEAHGVPFSRRIRAVFSANPTVSLTATDVQRVLNLPADKEPVVRQNLRRLLESEFLLREDRGLYRLNPVPHAPPPDED